MIENRRITIRNQIQQEKPVELAVGRCLRSVPGRRAVYEGIYNERAVIIKVFSSAFHGWRHFRRELKGFHLLAARDIPSATVLEYGRDTDGHWVLVLEKIDNAGDIYSTLTTPGNSADRTEILRKILCLLAQMHATGVFQRDLHLGNFLWDGTVVYALDPAQMRFYHRAIAQKQCIRQLAGLTTAFMSSLQNKKKELLDVYFQKRGWKLNDAALDQIEQFARKTKQRGIKRSQKKILRTCTQFVRHKSSHYVGMFDRGVFEHQDLSKMMAELNKSMEAGQVLKRGNTSFVSRIQLNGNDVVIKRYNHQGLWHSLRHTIKGSRARKCWLFGHRLIWLDIPTARPLAFIEQRKYGLIQQSWILNEYIEGQNIREYLSDADIDEQKRQEVLAKTNILLEKIVEHRITHGDLKATNILIHNGQPVLIDLDSMKRHRCKWLLKQYQQKMKNKIREQNL